jgi:DNA modification methylase
MMACACEHCGHEFDAEPEGGHRLLCGDNTVATDVERVLGGQKMACILTDPPYCSGGFQESGKASGSIDKLSTRGYMSLIKSAISLCSAPLLYVFTDWRMWVNLFDTVESAGFAVRNMIVWHKDYAGMGVGWRTQHELVLFGSDPGGTSGTET